jgi:hypothetical protein
MRLRGAPIKGFNFWVTRQNSAIFAVCIRDFLLKQVAVGRDENRYVAVKIPSFCAM